MCKVTWTDNWTDNWTDKWKSCRVWMNHSNLIWPISTNSLSVFAQKLNLEKLIIQDLSTADARVTEKRQVNVSFWKKKFAQNLLASTPLSSPTIPDWLIDWLINWFDRLTDWPTDIEILLTYWRLYATLFQLFIKSQIVQEWTIWLKLFEQNRTFALFAFPHIAVSNLPLLIPSSPSGKTPFWICFVLL